ncbi:MAG: hypothetical protein MJ058_04595 [Akkermansia sp.]|nr:hypothetical protein [Akkermansia sp.]
MKLHLPKGLRAALIAAFGIIGFTLPQTQAWDGGPEDDVGGMGHVYYLNNGKEGVSLTDTSRNNLVITPNATNVTGEISSITTKDGASVRFTGSNGWHNDWQFSSLLVDMLQAGEDGQGTVSVSTEQKNASRPASDTTVSILAVSGTVGSVENYGVLTLGSAGGTITASGALNNHDGATLTIDGSYVFDVSDTTKYTLKSEGSVEWSDSANSQGFKKTTGSTYYAIKGATEGANIGDITSSSGTEIIRESSGNYYFEGGAAADFDYTRFYVKADTATLEHDGEGQIVVEKEGATLTVRNATYRDTSGPKNLNIVVGEGGVLEVTHSGGTGYVTGDITIQGGGTFRVAGQHDAFGWGDTTTKSIILQGSDDSHVATLDLQQTTGNSATMNAALKLMGNAAVTGAKGFNTHDGSFYAEGVNNSIESFQIRHAATFEVKEGGELSVGTMTKGQDGNKTLTKTGMGTMTFTTKAQAEALVINEGAIVISGSEENSFNAITIGESGTLKLTDSASLTMSGNLTSAGAIIKDGDGSLVFSGAQNVLSHVITLQGGALTLSGAYDVSELAGGGGGDGYIGGEVEGNGFLSHGELVAHVVDITDGASLSADGTFTANGAVGSFDTATGNATFGSGTSYSVYYVNVAGSAEGLAHAIEAAGAQGEQIGEVRLANNTALNLNSADAVLPLLAVAADADAALNVTENSSITRVTGAAVGHALTVNGTAGTTLTIGASAADSYSGAGSLVIAEGATVLMQGNNTNFTGDLVINGTVVVGPGSKGTAGTNALGTDTIAETATRTITINSTGVLDLNGLPDTKYAYVLAGGKLTNSGQDIGSTLAQTSGLKLTADSTVEAGIGHEFWLLSGGYAANKADLQGFTLVKTGDGRFGFRSSTITAGTLEARNGEFHFNNSNTVADMLLTGGTFTGAVDVKDDITVTTRATADMTAALNIAEADKVVTFSVDADQTHTQSGAVSGSGAIAKGGAGTLTLSAANTVTSVTLTQGTIKATAAGALGSGTTTVAAGTTLEMTVGNAVSGTGSVSNAGNVLIHNTLTTGTINGGVLTLADDFAVTGDLEDVDGLTDTGNGFSQGGVLQVYDTATANLTNITSIVHGSDTYQLTDLVDGAISKGGADWTIYQLNQENDNQPTIKQIMDYAESKDATLASIAVNGDMLWLVDDSTAFKASMLSGTDEHLQLFSLMLDDGAVLGMDADVKGGVYLSTDTESHATINLEKDVTVGMGLEAYNEGSTSNLTIDGAHTLSTPYFGVESGTATLQGGAHLVVTEADGFGVYIGDTLTVKGASEFSIPNTGIKSVDGIKDAVLTNESSEYAYDIADPGYTLADAELTVGFADAHELGNVLSGAVAVVNAGAGTLTDVNTVNLAYDGLHAQGGNIVLQGKGEDVSVRNLTVDAGRSVSMTDTTAGIVVSGTATFGNGSTVGSALTMAAGSTLEGATALASHALSLEGGINIGDTLWSTLTALPAQGSANIFTGVSALTLAGAQYTDEVDLNDIFDHVSLKDNKFTLSYDGSNVIVTKNLENNRYWKGGDGTWDYSEEKWTDEDGTGTDVPFVSGYNAHFTAANGGTVTLGVDITAASITVTGADYTFAAGGHTLTVNNAFEVDGHTATLQGLGLNGANLKLTAKNGGSLKLGADSSVKDVEIGSGSTIKAGTATLAVAGGFVNNGSLSAGTLTLSQGTAQGGNVDVGSLNLDDNKSYTFGNLNAATISGSADVTIGAGGVLNTSSSSLKSLSAGAGAQLSGTITASGTTTIDTAATLAGTLTTGTLAGSGKLTLNNNANLTVTSDTTLTNLLDLATNGTTTITSNGVTLTLKGTVDNAATGTVTFVGTFDVGNCTTIDGTATYVGGDSTANGFKQAQKIVSVIDEGTANGAGATLTYNGTAIGQMGTNGKVTFQGDTDYTKFYVNTGSENASKALTNPDQKLGTFELAAGTKLVADRDIDISKVNAAGAATLEIASGHRVNSNGAAKDLLLKGEGTYALASGVSKLGVVLDDSWAGTVSFTAADLNTLDGAWKSGSTVILTGTTGILGAADNEATIVLNKGEGDWGFGQTGDGMYSATLNGAITGDGNLGVKSGTATSIFELNGNTADWTGNFIVATAADVTLSLGGDAKTINGSVSGSNLTLKLKTDATLKSDSTVARVNATAGSLKVDAGKRLTVTDTILPDNIKLGAGASIAAAFMGGTEYGYMDGIIANETGGDQAVSINNADITVTGATLCTGGGTGFTVDNKLADAKLLVAETLTKAVVLSNVQDSLEVADNLAIGAGGLLKVANGGSKQELVIGGTTLTLGDGTTLDANVAIGSGATLTLNYNTGGTPVATTLNSGALALANGLTLSGNVYNQMAAFTDADDNTVVDLFRGVGALTLGGSAYTGEVNAMQYFTNLTGLSDLGDFTLLYNDSTDTVSIRFNLSEARTLTWNGTEGNSAWEVGDGTAENWLDATQQDTHFDTGDNARFTGDAAKKQVTIADGRTEARDITISGADAQYAFAVAGDSTLAASNLMKVSDGATLAKTGAGNLTLELSGALGLENGTLEVQEGGLAVATITADADSTITLDGTLRVAQGSINGITAHEGSTLVIGTVGATDAGTLAITTDTSLYGLVNQGTLNIGTNELTLKQATAQGGNVVAGTLSLEASGSSFGNVTANSIHFAYGTLDVADPNVTVDTIAANGAFPVVTLDLTEALADGGSLAPLQRLEWATTYTLVHANGGLEGVNFTLGETLGLLVQNGLIHEGSSLVKTDNDVKLTVGGQDLTWYTSNTSTEWGYNVVTGGNIAHGANTLNGVQHVVVDQSLDLDVTGVGAAPGLRMRNLSGAEGETLTFTGGHGDAVTLITTEDTESTARVNARGIALHVGLDAYDELDNTDYAKLKLGALDLEDAALIVNGDASFTVDTLNGDDASLLAGKVVVEGQGGYYSGRYSGAEVVLHEDAVQTLAAGHGLTVEGDGTALLTYEEGVTHMDGIAGIGLTLLLNDPNEDSSASTLVLDNDSGLLFGSIHAGISAINSALTLDTDEAPDLVEAESLNLDGSTIVLHQAEPDGAALAMATTEGAQKKGIYLAHLGADDSYADVDLDGNLLEKYYQNARLEGGNVLVDRRTDFYSDLTQAQVHAPNARAGAGLLDDALLHSNPQVTNPEGDLAGLMTALELGYVPQRQVENVMAAVSGASHAALGAAWNHDVDRQLRAIRNRTTQMGLAGAADHEGLPYFNAWINAEGDYRKMNADGTLAGYKLTSWGGTLGVDVDCTPNFTLGLAVTAMTGDFTAESAEQAKGDLDRVYFTVFGRYTHRSWSHTLVATYGTADTKLDRTVDAYATGYSTTSDSDGTALGIMYELGYAVALTEDASTCIQPVVNLSYRTSTLKGCAEKSKSDAALKLGDAEAKVFTAALGARIQSTIGTSVYNRATLFEGRVLFKGDSGDRDVVANNSFLGVPGGRDVKSAKLGAFGVEVGAGVTIPLAESAGAIFFDVTGEFRSKYTEVNGTVGYRFNF